MFVKRFVILTSQRTGSTLLVRSLDSHPEVSCPGEMFYPKRASELTFFSYLKQNEANVYDVWFRRRQLVNEYLDWFYSAEDLSAIGFKFMYGQARRFPRRFPQVVDYIKNNNIVVFHNIRENYLAVMVSRVMAKRTGIYRAEEPIKTVAVSIPVRGLVRELEKMRQADEQWAEYMMGAPYYRVSYESLVEEPKAQTARLLSILDIRSDFDLHTGLTKVAPKQLANAIENYAEVEKELAGTRFEYCLDSKQDQGG